MGATRQGAYHQIWQMLLIGLTGINKSIGDYFHYLDPA